MTNATIWQGGEIEKVNHQNIFSQPKQNKETKPVNYWADSAADLQYQTNITMLYLVTVSWIFWYLACHLHRTSCSSFSELRQVLGDQTNADMWQLKYKWWTVIDFPIHFKSFQSITKVSAILFEVILPEVLFISQLEAGCHSVDRWRPYFLSCELLACSICQTLIVNVKGQWTKITNLHQ